MRKIFSLLIALIVCFSAFSPVTAFAATSTTPSFEVVSKYQATVAANGKLEVTLSVADSIRFEKGTLGVSLDYSELKYDSNTKKFTFVFASNVSKTLSVEISKLVKNTTGVVQKTTLSSTDRSKYLLKETKIELDDSRIKAKSTEITKNLTDDAAKTKAIYEYVTKNVTYSTDKAYANKGAVSALTNKKGVCEDYANLMVALCRSSNIPARMVYGYMIKGDEKIAHAWNEVYYNGGWHSMEPTINADDPVKYGFDKLSAAVYYYELGYEPDELAGSALVRTAAGTQAIKKETVWLARTK